MVDSSENTDLKIVDFGLSKIIGPNETSLDPFGTLVRTFTNCHVVICCTRGVAAKTLRQGSRLMVSWCHNLPAFEQSAAL